MPTPIVLYSTNTWLAYHIQKRFYGDVHYVWCSPFWSEGATPAIDATTPPSSSPQDIYRRYKADVVRNDGHSDPIERNRAGLRRGAAFRRDGGVINDAAHLEIEAIVGLSQIVAFRPLLYVIPFALVADLVKPAPVEKRANPLSEEYIIENLPRACFDVIELAL